MRIPSGYIIVRGTVEEGGIIALSRGNKKRRPQWIRHGRLPECYVHSMRAIRRAIRRQRQWTLEASFAVGASYDPKTTYAIPAMTSAVPFLDLKKQLFGEGATA